MSESEGGFSIKETAKRQFFLDEPAAEYFIGKWCQINDSIDPLIVSRDVWDDKVKNGILQATPSGKKELYIPKDIHLWEMFAIAQVVDNDTFSRNPQQAEKKQAEFRQLGELFVDSGVYFAQQLPGIPIDGGRDIAERFAREFYAYGRSLTQGEEYDADSVDIQQIASSKILTADETEAVDRWLAGDALYNSRKARAEKLVEHLQEQHGSTIPLDRAISLQRNITVRQFFSVTQKAIRSEQAAFDKQAYAKLKAWKYPEFAAGAFLTQIKENIQHSVKLPEIELTDAFYRRGIEMLVEEIKEPTLPADMMRFYSLIDHDIFSRERQLIEALKIDDLKQELDQVRETGDLTQIGNKEREIALKIQNAMDLYPYVISGNNPSDMARSRELNCVGYSLLGGALLDRVGIKYLGVGLPRHSITILITSDNKAYWQDMQSATYNVEIKDEDITTEPVGFTDNATKLRRKTITVQNLVDLANGKTTDSLTFFAKSDSIRQSIFWIKENEKNFSEIVVGPPNIVLKNQILGNTALNLSDTGKYAEAELFAKKALETASGDAWSHGTLGLNYLRQNHLGEAQLEYLKALKLNPYNENTYRYLITINQKQNTLDQARALADRAIDMGLKSKYMLETSADLAHKNNDYTKAVERYKQVLEVTDKGDIAEVARIQFNIGSGFSLIENYPEAATAYEEVLKLIPSHALAHRHLARAYLQIGDLDRSEEHALFLLNNLNPQVKENETHVSLALEYLKKIRQMRREGL
jgi:tetratricopeptide (TPR) repeat protein